MPPRAPEYQSGQAIPGTVYRVHHMIGSGGMGTVYDVEDITVGKRYVLKTLHGDLADRLDLAARLAREARALAKLQHPNIVEVYTSGTTQDALKLPFYVMERLQGQSLSKVIELKKEGGQALSAEQACDIGIDLLDALDHAHEFGIIHRDVKPDNIFVTRGRDGRPLAKLLDFGIIKLATGAGSNPEQQTGGRFIGTFRYAPPEQILAREVTARSDLYAAGLVLYEMIAGRGPFDDFTGEMEIGKAHIGVEPPTLSRFVKVHPAVEALIMSALQKDPERRPRDAFTFASALRELKRQLWAPSPHVSPTQVATVVQVVEPSASAAQPVMPFVEVSHTDLVPSGAVTRVDVPAGMQGGHSSSRVTHTMALGVLPHSAPPQDTFSAAPLSMAIAEVPMIVDRRAETRDAVRHGTPQPNNDTAPIPLSVLAPRRMPASAVAPPQTETFGAHTTVASQRKARTRSTLLVLGGVVLAAAASLSTFVAWRHHVVASTGTLPLSDVPSARSVGTILDVPPANTSTATVATIEVAGQPSASQQSASATETAPMPKHSTASPTRKSTTTASNTATPVSPVTLPPPSATTAHRRPGSGL